MTTVVQTTRRDGIFVITLNRPKANAVNGATSRELSKAFVEYRDDDSLRCAIFTGGTGRIFSAGWDLKAASQGETEDEDFGPSGFAGITEMWDLNKPVIAAVNGITIGGGFEIALACDLIVAVEEAFFSLPETTVGVAADGGGLQRLPRKIPLNVAMDLLLTGRRMDAQEAHHWGLVNYVVPSDQLMAKAFEIAQLIVDGAPLSVMAVKEVIRETDGMTVRESFDAINERRFPIHAQMLVSEDHHEGPLAFAEKRKPNWKGR